MSDIKLSFWIGKSTEIFHPGWWWQSCNQLKPSGFQPKVKSHQIQSKCRELMEPTVTCTVPISALIQSPHSLSFPLFTFTYCGTQRVTLNWVFELENHWDIPPKRPAKQSYEFFFIFFEKMSLFELVCVWVGVCCVAYQFLRFLFFFFSRVFPLTSGYCLYTVHEQ